MYKTCLFSLLLWETPNNILFSYSHLKWLVCFSSIKNQAQNQTDYNSASPNVWGQMIYVLFYGLCDGLHLNVRTSVCVCVCIWGPPNCIAQPLHSEPWCCGGSEIQTTTRLHTLLQTGRNESERDLLNQMLLGDLSVSNQTPSLLLGWHEGEV